VRRVVPEHADDDRRRDHAGHGSRAQAVDDQVGGHEVPDHRGRRRAQVAEALLVNGAPLHPPEGPVALEREVGHGARERPGGSGRKVVQAKHDEHRDEHPIQARRRHRGAVGAQEMREFPEEVLPSGLSGHRVLHQPQVSGPDGHAPAYPIPGEPEQRLSSRHRRPLGPVGASSCTFRQLSGAGLSMGRGGHANPDCRG